MGCSPWGCEESDTTERLHFHFSLSGIGEGNGNPLQCSWLENPRDGGAWWAAVYGVAQSQTRLKRLSSSSSSSSRRRRMTMMTGYLDYKKGKGKCHHDRQRYLKEDTRSTSQKGNIIWISCKNNGPLRSRVLDLSEKCLCFNQRQVYQEAKLKDPSFAKAPSKALTTCLCGRVCL